MICGLPLATTGQRPTLYCMDYAFLIASLRAAMRTLALSSALSTGEGRSCVDRLWLPWSVCGWDRGPRPWLPAHFNLRHLSLGLYADRGGRVDRALKLDALRRYVVIRVRDVPEHVVGVGH